MNPLDFLFQEAIAPSRGLATDRHLRNGFQRATRPLGGILRVYTLRDEGISAGRYHRLGGRAERRAWRRLSGGRAVGFGKGTMGFSLLLPHRSALIAEEPLALAPYQVPNRYVRGVLRALRALGIDAFYPGRDFITVNRRTIGMVTFDVDENGALVFEGILALDRPFELRHAAELSGESDGGIQGEIFARELATSLGAEAGRSRPAREVAEALALGYADQFRLEIRRRELSALEEQAIAAIEVREFGGSWLRARSARDELSLRAVTPIALGVFEAKVALEQGRFLREVQLGGDFIANASAIEELEHELRLCPADWGSVAMVADRIFGRPENFVLGIGKVRTIPDTIMRAVG